MSEIMDEEKIEEEQIPLVQPTPEEVSGLLKKSRQKIGVFLLSMTIAISIVILKQGEKLFLFNFTSNNMNDVSTFLVFRVLMLLFLVFTIGYFLYFSVVYAKRKILSEEEQTKSFPDFKKQFDLFDLLTVVPTFLAVFVIITGFFVGPAVVEGESMQPTYYDGDAVLIYYFMEEVQTEDVVIVDIGSELLIKRLCGMPGDHLKIDATGVYLNDTLIESYVPEHFVPEEGFVPYFLYDQIIPEGSYFVMGDNRLNSTDGRRFGLVERDQLLGIVILPN